MREVSCRVLEVWERAALEHGLNFADMTRDLPVSLARLRDPSEWIDWDVLMEIVDRFEAATSPMDIVRFGRGAIAQEVSGPLRRIAGLAMSLVQLYRVAMQWQLPLIHRNLRVKFQTTGRRSLLIELAIPPYYRGSPAWFRVMQGGIEAMPRIHHLPDADVRAEISSHRGVYHVTLPEPRVRLLSFLNGWRRSPALEEIERQVGELRSIDREQDILQNALQERERMLTNLTANLSGMVYRCRGADLAFEFASERSRELTGYEAAELVGQRMSSLSLVHAEDVPEFLKRRQACLEAQQPCSLEYRLRTRTGDVRWVLDVSRGLYNGQGRLIGCEGFITDVTARKRLEEELAHAHRVEGIGRLAGGIAHDFNNLLTVILGAVELAQLSLPASSRAFAYTDQAREAAERAAALTQQLLAFARKQVIEPRVVNLNTLVQGMSTLLRRTLAGKVEVRSVPSKDLWSVEVDPGQFEQVLLNLAINARDAMPEGGTLTIETANLVCEAETDALPGLEPGSYVLLSVSDTGSGMSEEVQRRVFEPFFTTKEVGKGTGLGLASSHGIVRQARGHIFVSSEPGKGSSFRIYLPRSMEEAPPLASVPPQVTRGGERERLLVVEDHELVRGMMVHALAQQDYAVLAASSAAEALDIVRNLASPPDMLLTDIVMPQTSGVELAAMLRERFPHMPVLYLSGYSEHYPTREDRGGTLAAFLQKPFTSTALVGKVREILDRQKATSPTRALGV